MPQPCPRNSVKRISRVYAPARSSHIIIYIVYAVPYRRCAAIGRVLPRLARAVLAATGAEDYNELQNNGAAAHQAVFHVHFHIIPRIGEQGLGVGWQPGELEDPEGLLARIHTELQA